MELVRLQDDQRNFFDQNGYLVVPSALNSEEIEKLINVSDRMVEEFVREQHPDARTHYVQRRPGIVEVREFHPLMAHSATVPLLVQLLSANIHLHTTAIIYKYPQDDAGETPERGWHRDIGMTEDLGHGHLVRAGIKVGYCLTDFTKPRSGFTMFAPGSHLLPTPLPIPKGGVDPQNAVDLCLEAGDAFLFENRLFHTAAPNLSQQTSKVVIFGYSYRWIGGSRDNLKLVQPGEEVLAQVDDIRKQLLGGPCDALIDWAKQHGIAREQLQWTMDV